MSALPAPRPVTVPEFRDAKARGAKLAVVTAYDYTSARLCDEAGVDCILVGDSLGMVIQGHPTSLPVTLDEMLYHTRCVVRGVRRALVVVDMPFMTYQVSPEEAVRNAGRMLRYDVPGCNRFPRRIASCSSNLTPRSWPVLPMLNQVSCGDSSPSCSVQHVRAQRMAGRKFGMLDFASGIARRPILFSMVRIERLFNEAADDDTIC